MVRRLKRVTAGAFALILLGTLAAPAAAEESAHIEDFSFERWETSYELDIVDDVALAHITETMVVQFPDYDQNRGLERRLPLRYERAPAAPQDINLTDADGIEVPFDTAGEDGMRVISIGGDDYVQGQQTYQLSYTVENIIDSPARAEGDVFSWELVPSSRSQPIDQASAEITLSQEFAEAFTGDASVCRCRSRWW